MAETVELSIELPAETKRVIERAAVAKGMSVAEFLEEAVRKHLVDTDYIDEEAAN